MASWFAGPEADPEAVRERESINSSNRPAYRKIRTVNENESAEHVEDERIYMLGTGSIGKLVAHSLRGLPEPPPVTLLFHRGSYLDYWRNSPQEIVLTTQGVDVPRKGIDVELARVGFRRHGNAISADEYFERGAPSSGDAFELPDAQNKTPITNLIVSVKAPSTVSALSAIKHRLNKESSILFLQNGMGIVEKVNEQVFPDPDNRPIYLQGVITHGVYSKSVAHAVHAGLGTIQICVLPRDGRSIYPKSTPRSARYLMRTLCQSPVLAAVGYAHEELLLSQLQKLAVNAVINPITALLDAPNGALLNNFHMTRATRLLLAEVSLVIRSLPELQYLPDVSQRFSVERLARAVMGVADKTQGNISSMLADVRDGARTEVEFINGYIVKRGEELGIKCVMNYLIMCLVNGKHKYIDQERQAQLPLPGSPGSRAEDPRLRNMGSDDEFGGIK